MQLYLIIAAAFVIWSGGITTTAYFKGDAHGEAKAKKNCALVIQAQDTAITAQKVEAAKIIAFEAANVAATEQKLRTAKDQQEVTDANNQKKINGLSNSVRLLTGAVGRLRDYADAGCGESGSSPQGSTAASTGDSADHDPERGRLLSKSLSDFLLDQARSADEINAAYASCRADSFTIRATK